MNKIYAGIVVFGVILLALVQLPPTLVLALVLKEDGAVSFDITYGTLWHGQGKLSYLQQDLGLMSWEVEWLSFLQGAPWFNFKLVKEREGLPGWYFYEISGKVKASLLDIQFADLMGKLEADYLASLLTDNPSSLEVNDQVLFSGHGHWQRESLDDAIFWHQPKSIGGEISWPGGNFTMVFGTLRIMQEFPKISGVLVNTNEQLELELNDAETRLLAKMTLDRKALLEIQLYYHLLTQLKLPITQSEDEEGLKSILFDLSDWITTQ